MEGIPHTRSADQLTTEQAVGTLAQISDRLIRVLPPAFLLLVLMNIMFLGVLWWAFDSSTEQRNLVLAKIIDRCMVQPK